MALKKIVEVEGESYIQSAFGAVETGIQKTTFVAVCKVTAIQGNKDALQINVTFESDDIRYIRKYNFYPSVAEESSNFIKQAYLYLKTLPEFAGAEDC